ncbi:eukaryotic translation initiation factor 3 subunit H-like [Enhydra lutris kenyoni]|uniref:Eukaryotic translation initiation factor 3 subunit H-like n=1 Tax=Enhydra lutris kenyoni TaxID=391180 RepID=A0A2Y9ITN4_ENHLU|nr:eukaryotic translation initiation factor 3 subunit H-like [Enhydra lutris kenyoni]
MDTEGSNDVPRKNNMSCDANTQKEEIRSEQGRRPPQSPLPWSSDTKIAAVCLIHTLLHPCGLKDCSTGKDLETGSNTRTLRPCSFKWTLETSMAPMASPFQTLKGQLLRTGQGLACRRYIDIYSHLINVLMWELEKKSAVADKHELLSLASSNHLGKNLQLLMDRVDEMSQDIVKYNTYMRNTSKQQQQKHQYQQRRQQENMQRQSRGEPPLPEEDLSKLFKPPQPPARMDSLLIAGQINTYCQNIKEFTAQNLGKLFMAQALQEYNN